jgi:transcriptional regulator with XRE-family HTH domain
MRASETVDGLLEARGSTKKWLAAKLGLTPSALSRYLYGSRPAPPDLYQRVADVLQVPEALFDERVVVSTPRQEEIAAA